MKDTPEPVTKVTSLSSNNSFKQQTERKCTLQQYSQFARQEISPVKKTSQAAYHAQLSDIPAFRIICPTAKHSLGKGSAIVVSMIKHDMVRIAVEHLNPNQSPEITFNQPLFT